MLHWDINSLDNSAEKKGIDYVYLTLRQINQINMYQIGTVHIKPRQFYRYTFRIAIMWEFQNIRGKSVMIVWFHLGQYNLKMVLKIDERQDLVFPVYDFSFQTVDLF